MWGKRISGRGAIFHGAFGVLQWVLSWAGERAVIVDPVLAFLADCGWPRWAFYADPMWPLERIKSLKPLFVSLSCG